MKNHWDVIVIGAGIVGTAIARALSRYSLSTLVVDRSRDLGTGTSKANSAIIHTGFDAPVGSLEAQLLQRSRVLWDELLENAPIPWVPTGAYMLACSSAEVSQLALYEEQARANGVLVERVTGRYVREAMPQVTGNLREALWISGERVIDPFSAIRAFAEQAATNGVEFHWRTRVLSLEPKGTTVHVTTTAGTYTSQWVVNAGGLWGDDIARTLGDPIDLHPRKGQFLVVEEDLGIHAILLPVPTPISKGVIVTPIAFGGLLLGPTAEDQFDKEDWSTTQEGIEYVRQHVSAMVPALANIPSIRQFAGLRAVASQSDYAIQWSQRSDRVLHVLGIRSTGISASIGIAEYVCEQLLAHGLSSSRRDIWLPAPPLFAESAPEGGEEVLCPCRAVTWGEILRTVANPLPARTLDGIKRRSGAMLGECQGNRCMETIRERVASYLGQEWEEMPKGDEALVLPRVSIPTIYVAAPLLSSDQTEEIVVVGGGTWGRQITDALKGHGISPLVIDAAGQGTYTGTVVDVSRNKPGELALTVTNSLGVFIIRAQAVVLATGSMHQPPGALSIPGDRPAHVYTPDGLEEFWRRGYLVGARPVLVGLHDGIGTILSWAVRYQSSGIQPIVLISQPPPPDQLAITWHLIRAVQKIHGHGQFESITVVGVDDEVFTVEGDVLCFSGGRIPWIPYLKHHENVAWTHNGRLQTTFTGLTSIPRLWALPPLAQADYLSVDAVVGDLLKEVRS
ncbi:MAG: FAD-dependent oxidoreductase [Firmicutes bacterium]|nr:FAD-dependent oxidoreductase [Bacillota bacterium]